MLMGDTVHVLPVNDLKPHIESAACKCAPRVDVYERGKVVVHNSYDGREFYEPENCEHEWEWVGGHATPYGPVEPEQVCKHCGATNTED